MDAVLKLTYCIIENSRRLKNFMEDQYLQNSIFLLVIKLHFICIRTKQAYEADLFKKRSFVDRLEDQDKDYFKFYRTDDKINIGYSKEEIIKTLSVCRKYDSCFINEFKFHKNL